MVAAGPCGVLQVDAGWSTTFVVASDHTVWAWGNSAYGELGGYPYSVDRRAVHVPGLAVQKTVWAWGGNEDNQLGDGTTGSHATPEQVAGLPPVVTLASASAQGITMVVQAADGSVWGWGYGCFGLLLHDGKGENPRPERLSGVTSPLAISVGWAGSATAVRQDGTVITWGGSNGSVTTPATVTGVAHAVALARADQSSFALGSDGTVWAWGYGADGQLGTGTGTTSRTTAVRVPMPTTGKPITIGAGSFTGFAIVAGGS